MSVEIPGQKGKGSENLSGTAERGQRTLAFEAEMFSDPIFYRRHDVMDVALDGYGQLKLSGDAHGLEHLRKDLGARFSRSRRKEAAPEPT